MRSSSNGAEGCYERVEHHRHSQKLCIIVACTLLKVVRHEYILNIENIGTYTNDVRRRDLTNATYSNSILLLT
jgi:hypothetical protein